MTREELVRLFSSRFAPLIIANPFVLEDGWLVDYNLSAIRTWGEMLSSKEDRAIFQGKLLAFLHTSYRAHMYFVGHDVAHGSFGTSTRIAASDPGDLDTEIRLNNVSWDRVQEMVQLMKRWSGGNIRIVATMGDGAKITIDLPPSPAKPEVPPNVHEWAKEKSTPEILGKALQDIQERGRVKLGDAIREYKESAPPVSRNPERIYEIYMPYLVREALEEFFDQAMELPRDDQFGPSLDMIKWALSENPYQGTKEEEIEWQGKPYQSWSFTTPFLRVLYFIDEEQLEVTIFTPIELMPGCSFSE